MEETTSRVRLYVVRDFSQKLTATMDFLRGNWRVLLKYLIYFLLPISLVQALGLNGFMDSYLGTLSSIGTGGDGVDEGVGMVLSFVLSLLGYAGLGMVGALMLEAVVYALMRVNDESDVPLSQLQWADLKRYFWQGIRRTLVLSLVSIGLLSVFFLFIGVLVAVLGDAGVIVGVAVFYLALIVVGIAFTPFFVMLTPTYVMQDDVNVLTAIQKAFRYGFSAWGGTWAIVLVLGFLTNVISGATMMPWYFCEMFKMVLGFDGADDLPFVNSYAFSFVLYLLAIVQCFGNYLVSLILYIGFGYCYGHAAEKVDGLTVESNIQQFDTL